MDKRKKIILPFFAVLLVACTAILLIRYEGTSKYRKLIPELPDLTSLPAPLKDQLTAARLKAFRNPGSLNLGNLGMVFHSAAFYDKAGECYRLAIKKDGKNWIWSYYLGLINMDTGDSRSAIENFNAVINKNPRAYLAWYYLGKAYQNAGSSDKAGEALVKIAFLPENVTVVKTFRVNYSSVPTIAKFELARIYLNEGKLDEAANLLEGIISVNHSIGAVYRLLGNVYSAKGDQVLAAKYITRAQDLAEVTSLADTLADNIALLSRSPQYLPKQIDDALKSANPKWALCLLNNALKYLPDDKYIISKAVKFYLVMDTGKESLPFLEKHFYEFRDDANELEDVADMLYKKGFYTQSMPYFSRAMELEPSNNELQASYALSCWYAHNSDSANEIMKKLYGKNNRNPKVLANEVAFMLISGEKAGAESFIKIFMQIAPNDPKLPKLEAMLAESDGKPMKALPLFEASFKLDPGDLETAKRLGSILIDQKMWPESVKMFRTALKNNPNNPYLLESLGALLISCPDPVQRNTDEGIEYSDRAFCHISSPSNIIISSAKNLAQGYAVKGNFKKAAYYITVAVNMAREENSPRDFMEELMSLASKIKYFSQK